MKPDMQSMAGSRPGNAVGSSYCAERPRGWGSRHTSEKRRGGGESEKLPFKVLAETIAVGPDSGELTIELSVLTGLGQPPIPIGRLQLQVDGGPQNLSARIEVPNAGGVFNFIDTVVCDLQVEAVSSGGGEGITIRVLNSLEAHWTIGEMDIDLIGAD